MNKPDNFKSQRGYESINTFLLPVEANYILLSNLALSCEQLHFNDQAIPLVAICPQNSSSQTFCSEGPCLCNTKNCGETTKGFFKCRFYLLVFTK